MNPDIVKKVEFDSETIKKERKLSQFKKKEEVPFKKMFKHFMAVQAITGKKFLGISFLLYQYEIGCGYFVNSRHVRPSDMKIN